MSHVSRTRPISWTREALRDFQSFPAEARVTLLTALSMAAAGVQSALATKIDGQTHEVALPGCAPVRYQLRNGVRVHSASQPESDRKFIHGSGNVFEDLGEGEADTAQFRAKLAAEVIRILDREQLAPEAAQQDSGVPAADFNHIRNADLSGFTIDRLISILNRLGSRLSEIR